MTPHRLTSIVLRHRSNGISPITTPPAPIPALLTTTSAGLPEPRLGGVGHLGNGVGVGNVADMGESVVTDLSRGLLRGGSVDIRADHTTAAAGDLESEGPADTTACAGDHRGGTRAAATPATGSGSPHVGRA